MRALFPGHAGARIGAGVVAGGVRAGPVSATEAPAEPPPAVTPTERRARCPHDLSEQGRALPALSAALRGLYALPRAPASRAGAALAAALALVVLAARRKRRAANALLLDDLSSVPQGTAARARAHDLCAGPRDIVIVTTAALPWMTGTAVNPVLRAAALARDGHTVTLVVPWLESAAEQRRVYGRGRVFRSREEQMAAIQAWAAEQTPGPGFGVRFYDGVYSDEFNSILPVGDLPSLFANGPCDVAVLEEPEHLTWHHPGRAWTDVFNLVVGVVHTNYLEYASKHGALGPVRSAFLRVLNAWVCAAHCHRVIRLSAAVQRLPGAVTENVHGVRDEFLRIGDARANRPFGKGAYFLGKVLWEKGYRELFDLLDEHARTTGAPQRIDLFGGGPDLDAVRARVASGGSLAAVRVHGVVIDHASEYLNDYQVYVNASRSDVVCTATAEALAMGKRVVVLRHPSNAFFARFRNCAFYESPEQFSEALSNALETAPVALSDVERDALSWTAATRRFYDAIRLDAAPKQRPRVASALAHVHAAACSAVVPPAHNAVRQRYRRELLEAPSPNRSRQDAREPDPPRAPAPS